ncbi:MAG: prepilin-type N-terminal cleavage/methylation domain-containing protein [Acidobacteriota bacterium]|nr:prepilin-type N-terminal cleavage/methylation domain-containing protein [Acidobacteriota bacterium]
MAAVTAPAAPGGERGFSLIETMIALGILATGLLGAAAVLTTGMQRLAGSPAQVIATQKAAEAIESVFAARDSHVITWAQIRNVKGASGSDGGIFLDGPQPLRVPGPDGLVNTADDGAVETVTNPGPDGLIGTADDQVVPLAGYTREIKIRDIQTDLRTITVTVTYQDGDVTRSYVLTSYISNYA